MSCGTITKIIATGEYLEKRAASYVYEKPVQSLFQDVSSLIKKNKLGIEDVSNSYSAGFVFSGRLYASHSAYKNDLERIAFAEDKKRELLKVFEKKDYFILEQSAEHFVILYKGNVFEGKELGLGKSRLKVFKLTDLVRGDVKSFENKLILEKSGLFYFNQVVDLNSSLKKAHRNESLEWKVLKEVSPAAALQFEERAKTL